MDLGDGPAADAGEDVAFDAPPPVLREPPAAPAAALLFEDAPGGLGEGGNGVSAALLGVWIVARPGQFAVGEGQFAGLDEGDERGGAESEFPAPSADNEPLDAASDSSRLNEQVQAVPVRVPSWRGGTDEGGRERLVGMTPSALGFLLRQREVYDVRKPFKINALLSVLRP